MAKITQESIVVKRLLSEGKIDRNWCIRERYITRLGAIICNLKEKGWDFEQKEIDGNYWYFVTKSPFKRVVYHIEGREDIVAHEPI